MAAVTATNPQVQTLKSRAISPFQLAVIFFNLTGTYAQADNAIITGVPTLIANSRRNGRNISLKTVSLYQLARKASDPTMYMALKTLAISGSDVTCELTHSTTAETPDYTTEFTDATAVPAQSAQFGIIVGFEES
jgi:hypothetical protein